MGQNLMTGKSIETLMALDFEASSLSAESWPIDVGISWIEGNQVQTWSSLIRPASVWERADWSKQSEAVHGISMSDLIDGFANAHDAELMAEFHRAAPPGQLAVARAFADPRFRRLAMRILFVQAPQILAPRLSARIRAAILRRLMGGPEGQPWRSLDDAMKELASRANEAPSEAKLRISEWLVERASSTA